MLFYKILLLIALLTQVYGKAGLQNNFKGFGLQSKRNNESKKKISTSTEQVVSEPKKIMKSVRKFKMNSIVKKVVTVAPVVGILGAGYIAVTKVILPFIAKKKGSKENLKASKSNNDVNILSDSNISNDISVPTAIICASL